MILDQEVCNKGIEEYKIRMEREKEEKKYFQELT